MVGLGCFSTHALCEAVHTHVSLWAAGAHKRTAEEPQQAPAFTAATKELEKEYAREAMSP